MPLENLFGDLALDTTVQSVNTNLSNILASLTVMIGDSDDVEGLLTTLNGLVTALGTNTDGIEGLLTTIRDNADQVEALLTALGLNTDNVEALLTALGTNTDGIEALLTAGNALVTAVGNNTDGIEGLLTSIRDNADTVESLLTALGLNTDGIEGLLTALGNNTDGIEGLITASNALLTTIRDNADTVESLLTALGNNTDGVEGLLAATNALLTSLGTNTDGIEALITATNGLLTTIRDNADTVESLLTALGNNTDNIETLIGSTNTLLTAIQGFVDGVEGLLAALTNGTQKTQIVNGANTLAITAAGAAMTKLSGNAQLSDVGAWTPFLDEMLMVGGVVSGSSFSAALAVRAGSRGLLIEWVNPAGVGYGTVGNPVNVTGTVATAGLTDAQLRASPVPVDQANTADIDYDTGAGVVNQAVMGIALPGAGGPVAGGTAAAPVRTDPTGTTTQPISAAALPLPVGAATEATLAAVKTSIEIIDDWDEADRAKVNLIAGQAGVQGGSGAVSANTQRVVLATDVPLPAGNNNIGDVDVVSSALPAGASTSANQATEIASLASIDTSTKPATTFTADSVLLVANTATNLPAAAARRVLVKSERGNTAIVRVKQANTVSATSGFELSSGQAITLAVDNLSDVWVFTTGAAGHRVSYAVIP